MKWPDHLHKEESSSIAGKYKDSWQKFFSELSPLQSYISLDGLAYFYELLFFQSLAAVKLNEVLLSHLK